MYKYTKEQHTFLRHRRKKSWEQAEKHQDTVQ